MPRGAAPAEDGEPVVVISSSPSSADSGKPPAAASGAARGIPRSRLRSAKKPSRSTEPDETAKKKVDRVEVETRREEEEEEEEEEGSQNGILGGFKGPSDVVFPVRRVKILMTECEACRPGHESVFLVNKAVELFLENFVADAYKSRKKSLTYRDLSSTVGRKGKYQFLSDYVPLKIRAEDALQARASLES